MGEIGNRNLMDRYCERALAVGRLMSAAKDHPEGSRGLVKCARFHDLVGYEVLCEMLARHPRGNVGAGPHAARGGLGGQASGWD